MPEIKNSFLQGKMNKDLDERLMPNGQYRDAVNIEVSTSEGSDVGTVQNILGNKRIEDIVSEGFKCVGSIADEKTNKLYWFISKYNKDAIIEHDITNDKINPVVVDLNAANSKAVLKFSGNIITGINIINNLLFWTDNNSEPKKINIDACIAGTIDINTHTQLSFENGSFNAITLQNVSNSAGNNDFLENPPAEGRYFWFNAKQIEKMVGITAFASGDENYVVRHYRNNEFLQQNTVRFFGALGGNGTHARYASNPLDNDFAVGDILYGADIKVDIEERHVTVVKPKPLKAPTVKINHTQALDYQSNIPNLFETTFPRFSYRYKYRDGEVSAFAPFTQPVFNPKYSKDVNSTNGTNVFYTKDNAFDVKDPHNKAMVNSIHSIDLTDFITAQTPEDAIEVEILYKQEDSSVIYSIETIKHTDPQWHTASNTEGYNVGYNKAVNNTNFTAKGGYNQGKHVLTTENIYAALPANQLLRPWDNVPRKALGQEMTGNRIVYGNYLQNYNLGNIKPEIKVDYNYRNNNLGSFENQGLPSVKSQRNYQLGIVYCDKHGRETPVFTSKEGAVSIPWQKNDGTKNASKSLQLNTNVAANFPDWVDSFKVFVKETSAPYYNLVMDRAWVAKSTYNIDRGEHLWISFPSSDRNKISKEDYIILKKKIGAGENQVAFENKFKVIDIADEAPDAIKYELVNQGAVTNQNIDNVGYSFQHGSGAIPSLFPSSQNESRRIDHETDTIKLSTIFWDTFVSTPKETFGNVPLAELGDEAKVAIEKEDLYISWRRNGAPHSTADGKRGASSKKYKVIGGSKDANYYTLKLANHISQIDADLAHEIGKNRKPILENPNTNLNFFPDLVFQVEKRQLLASEDFSGKFFVKISKNQITDIIEEGSTTDPLSNYIVSAKTPTYYWQDDKGSNSSWENSAYGLTNYSGEDQSPSGANSIHNAANNNGVGTDHAVSTITTGRKLSDDALIWDGILVDHGPTFFIDAMHMVAGQSEASNLAKYCCVTWSGTQKTSVDNEDSAWSYPPVKTWLTDWVDSAIEVVTEEDTIVTAAAGSAAKYYDAINSGLIDTSPLNATDDNFKLLKEDAVGVKIAGWAGPSQVVNRSVEQGNIYANHVNGLEGLVTTQEIHATGPRRWFSGITDSSTEYGVGIDTNAYSSAGEIGRHFMHLSFFAPGRDLHNGSFNSNGIGNPGNQMEIFSNDNAIGSRLQGIWGGGVFTGGNAKHLDLLAQDRFGTGNDKFSGLPMEGNYDPVTNGWLPQTPGPGIGFGYNLDYQELHERQWDPTFNERFDNGSKIRDFLKNLHAGSQFKFSDDILENVYTIKKVVVKKLYNHTSWRTPFNRDHHSVAGNYYHPPIDTEKLIYKSVEETALEWLNSLDDTGSNGLTATDPVYTAFTNKIIDFGKASNRRVCYIIELDKNPAASTSSYNPLVNDGKMTADVGGLDFQNIEFLEKVQSTLLAGLNKFSAIWETDPKKQQVDLDIYYEASNNIPIKLNERTNELIAPVGCKVEMLGKLQVQSSLYAGAKPSVSYLTSWDGTKATLHPGLPIGDGTVEIEYSKIPFKFTKEDGSYVILIADEQQLLGQSVSNNEFKTTFTFRHDIGNNIKLGLAWNNCFSFGNGLESNRIKDDFNEIFIASGVKASTVSQETYREERRSSGLIYSGLYNSNSGVNDLNQFIMAEKITKDLNPTYGSIQKLFSRNSDLVAFCEDKVVKVLANKDAVFNADGNPQLTANENVLGQTIPFTGEFGISKNPESFASESYRAYFTDKQRGAVLRLSKDGLTPISKAGMQDYFRDNLGNYDSLIGSYDSYKEDYNITLSHKFGENFIFNSYFDEGIELEPVVGSLLNYIDNPGVAGVNFVYAYNIPANQSTGTLIGEFEWGPPDTSFGSEVLITNHPAIVEGGIQGGVDEVFGIIQEAIIAEDQEITAAVPTLYTTTITTSTGVTVDTITTSVNFGTYSAADLTTTGIDIGTTAYGSGGTFTLGTDTTAESSYDQDFVAGTLATSDDTPFAEATYSTNFSGNLPDFGWFYNPVFSQPADDIFGPNRTQYTDLNLYSYIKRHVNAADIVEGVGAPFVESPINYSFGSTTNSITRRNSDKHIYFDRAQPENSYIEFRNIGGTSGNPTAGINKTYADNAGIPNPHQQGLYHSTMFNGDELHVQFDLICFKTFFSGATGSTYYTGNQYGYNIIKPKLELIDNTTGQVVSSDFLVTPGGAIYQMQSPSDFKQYSLQQTSATTTSGLSNSTTAGAAIPSSYTSFSNSLFYGNPEQRAIGERFSNSATVEFPSTSTISDLNTTTVHMYLGGDQVHITCGASFKFKDPLQQNAQGESISTDPNFGITEAPVVQDLMIRISNSQPESPLYSGYGGSIEKRQQLWSIKNVRIKKGWGVTSPHQAFDAGTILADIYDTPEITTSAYTTITQAGADAVFADVVVQPQVQGVITAFVPAIPPTTIPPWVEVVNQGMHFTVPWVGDYALYGTLGLNTSNGSPLTDYSLNSGNVTTVSYTKVDGLTGSYQVPDGTQTITYPASQTGQVSISGQYLEVSAPSSNSSYAGSLKCDMGTNDQYESNVWYLVDLEFDEVHNPNTGDSTVGQVQVQGVAASSATNGSVTDPDGVGITRGAGSTKNIQLLPVGRTEYGLDQTVLRAIYQVDPTAAAFTSSQGSGAEFNLRFQGYNSTSAHFTKLIVKRLDASATDITPDNWAASTDVLAHSFSKKHLYYKQGKLCFDIDASNYPTNSNGYGWRQSFPANHLVKTPGGWSLRFTVSDNPDYPPGDHTGSLSVVCNNDIGVNGFEGLWVNDLVSTGNYEIKFNFDNNLVVSDSEDWGVYLDGALITTGTIPDINYSSAYTGQTANYGNQIVLMPNLPGPGSGGDFRMAISEISLIDNTLIFQGGTSGSWNWDGFDTSLQSYISWDDIENSNGIANNRIQFGEINYQEDPGTGEQTYDYDGAASFTQIDSCPFVDPLSIEQFKTPISANQFLNRTINRYEKYNIEFEHGITEGELDIYYFNSQGYGFRIPNINASTPNTAQFTVIVGQDQNDTSNIYSEKRSATHPASGSITYQPELQETFVISPSAFNAAGDNITGSNGVVGWIDGIQMTAVYDIELGPDGVTPIFEEKTVTFSEGVNGWTSFKSFVPESGVSLSKKYFTFDEGKLYKHYVPLKYDWSTVNPGFVSSTLSEAENYNIFYNDMFKDDFSQQIKATEKAKSSIKFVLNNEPGTIKMFNTLNYEGTQSHIKLPSSSNYLTINNAEAWQKGMDIQGWSCEEIKSDLDTGSVVEFIKKEGKWFNYIKGKPTQSIDTSLFSVQGIGTVTP